jgi:uncharacterized protein
MFRALALLLVLLAPACASAASFDCAKASHKLEKLICSDANLSHLDEEAARVYKERRSVLFDKNALRAMQNNWQQILRTRCETQCSLPEVTADYEQQIQSLKGINDETYDANYKTSDIATLNLSHLSDTEFGFLLTRENVDDGKQFCALPKDDSEAEPTAKFTSPDVAETELGACKITFKFKREDQTDSVVSIDISTTDACNSYCTDNFTLSDQNFIPENGWVPGNQ